MSATPQVTTAVAIDDAFVSTFVFSVALQVFAARPPQKVCAAGRTPFPTDQRRPRPGVQERN